ncbi:MAG: DUF6478 family protein [Pseudomonadota bacterium]
MEAEILSRISQKWAEQRFDRMVKGLSDLDDSALRQLRRRVRAWGLRMDTAERVIRDRLTLPREGAIVTAPPPATDIAERHRICAARLSKSDKVKPPSDTVLAEGLTLFHDCSQSEIILRQVRNSGRSFAAPYGLQIEVFEFRGTFLSLKLQVPFGASMTHYDIVTLRTHITMESKGPIFARLNIGKGAHIESVIREVPEGNAFAAAEFDFFFMDTKLDKTQEIWIDLSFDHVSMNRITIHDLVLFKSRRADI